MATLLTAAGLFSLLTAVLEAVRVYAIDSVDPGLARLGLPGRRTPRSESLSS